MKHIFTAVIILVFASTSANSQSINAGQYGLNDYYWNFEPNIWLSPEYPEVFSEIFPLDINNDGIIDLSFQTYYSEANFYYHRSWIMMKTHCEIAFSTDTCKVDTTLWPPTCENVEDRVSQVSKVFQTGEYIGESNNWIYKNEEIWVSYYLHGVCHPHCGHLITPAFIGARIFVDNDTLYGWVKLCDIFYWELAIDEYACNTNTLGIDELGSSLQVYPNPSQGIISFNSPFPGKYAIISIHDLNGQEIFRERTTDQKILLDISEYPSGVYILKCQCDSKIIIQKILKQ